MSATLPPRQAKPTLPRDSPGGRVAAKPLPHPTPPQINARTASPMARRAWVQPEAPAESAGSLGKINWYHRNIGGQFVEHRRGHAGGRNQGIESDDVEAR